MVLDLQTGHELAQVPICERIERKWRLRNIELGTGIATSASHVFAGDFTGRLHGWTLDTGEPVWQHKPQGASGFSGLPPVIAEGRLYVNSFRYLPKGGSESALYCYEQA